MEKSKVFVLFFILFCYYITVNAQTKRVEYSYDENGNRISRITYVIHKLTSRDSIDSTKIDIQKNNNYLRTSKNPKLVVYPNPTNGYITLKITGFTSRETVNYSLYTLSGQELISGETDQECTYLDLSAFPPGVFILNVRFRGKIENWKIIKKY
jgi:YD repeat-containing protein